MTNSKKITITSERRETFVIRCRGAVGVRGFCAACASETELLTLDEAVSETGEKWRDLAGAAATGALHAIETASGHLLICRRSLGDRIREEGFS